MLIAVLFRYQFGITFVPFHFENNGIKIYVVNSHFENSMDILKYFIYLLVEMAADIEGKVSYGWYLQHDSIGHNMDLGHGMELDCNSH